MYPDRSASIFLELRRLHNVKIRSADGNNRRFVVTRRFGNNVINTRFEQLKEARDFWRIEAMKMQDDGLKQHDFHIAGFHEED
jgi:hypothetical protein